MGDPAVPPDPPRRVQGVDVARAVAMLGMLVEHETQWPRYYDQRALVWLPFGRSAPLFVMLAGVGLTLATKSRRPFARTMVLARAPLLLLTGMFMTLFGSGVILQSFALFFVVGVACVRLPRRVLVALSAACLAGGPLLLTALRAHGALHGFGSTSDV